MRFLRNALPVVVVLAVLLAAMYPVALLFGLPLARQRMENLNNWVRATVNAAPVADLSGSTTLEFGGGASPGASDDVEEEGSGVDTAGAPVFVLVSGATPLDVDFTLDDRVVTLAQPLSQPLVEWGEELVPAPADGSDRVFTLADPTQRPAGLYLGDTLLERGSLAAVERADGVRLDFTVPGSGALLAEESAPESEPSATDSGAEPSAAVALVGSDILLEGPDFELLGNEVVFTSPPAFNTPIRLITGDYEYLDEASGTVVLAAPSGLAPRPAARAVTLAEALVGTVDGENRTFTLRHAPLVESDPTRRLLLEDLELSGAAERPEERVDGQRASFTFAGEQGIVTVEGVEQVLGRDFERDGRVITFSQPPPRNAALRQFRDYLISDPLTGTVTLAVAPQAGERLWAASYTYYDRPNCGSTALECFFSMPQHPVPFPNWIAERVVPFFTAYPFSDSRNIVRAVLYTAAGTLIALLIGAVLGVLLAVVFVRVRPFEQALLPWVIASQTIPVIALVPVLLLLLGNAGITVQTSLVPAAIIGAYIAFFPVTVGTVTGLRSVDPLALDLMTSYAATPLQVFTKVRFPAAVPFFFTSLKLGAAAALVGALVAEVESNNRLGLGYAIIGQVQAGDVADVWILLGISALLGIGLVGLVGLLQRIVAPWERPVSVGTGDSGGGS